MLEQYPLVLGVATGLVVSTVGLIYISYRNYCTKLITKEDYNKSEENISQGENISEESKSVM